MVNVEGGEDTVDRLYPEGILIFSLPSTITTDVAPEDK
jgi:hypothetical protein